MTDLDPSIDLGSNGASAIACGVAARFAFLNMGILIAAVAFCALMMFEMACEVQN